MAVTLKASGVSHDEYNKLRDENSKLVHEVASLKVSMEHVEGDRHCLMYSSRGAGQCRAVRVDRHWLCRGV